MVICNYQCHRDHRDGYVSTYLGEQVSQRSLRQSLRYVKRIRSICLRQNLRFFFLYCWICRYPLRRVDSPINKGGSAQFFLNFWHFIFLKQRKRIEVYILPTWIGFPLFFIFTFCIRDMMLSNCFWSISHYQYLRFHIEDFGVAWEHWNPVVSRWHTQITLTHKCVFWIRFLSWVLIFNFLSNSDWCVSPPTPPHPTSHRI